MSNIYILIFLISTLFIPFTVDGAPNKAPVPRGGFEKALRHPGFNPSKTSVMVADVDSGKTLTDYSSDLVLNPASCAKIITSAAALAILGPDYRMPTEFFTDVSPHSGTVGTLYVRGSGDPIFVNEEIMRMTADLYSKGIRRILNGVVVDNTFFDSYEYPHKDTGEGRAYTAKTAATAANFNSATVEVGPGPKAGAPGIVRTDPPTSYFEIVNKLVTGGKFSTNMSFKKSDDREVLTVTGRVPLRFAPQKFYRSVLDPGAYAAQIIAYWLGEAGISVQGPAMSGVVPKNAVKIATEYSKPLAEQVAQMNKASNNFMAEQILKHLGAVRFGAPGSTSKGVLTVEEYLASIGIPRGEYVIENGSGLSSVSRVSAGQLVKVLVASYKNPKTRDALVKSLSVLGLDGTTKKWRFAGDLTGKVYVKTGTINGVSTLAGFAPQANGKVAAFAILANGLPRGVWSAHEAQLAVVRAIVE